MSDERARLFVALELPTVAREALAGWRGPLLSGNGLRPLGTEGLHVTLCFLGWRPVDEVSAIATACDAVAGVDQPVELALASAVWLPARRPRVLAVELEDRGGRLSRLQASLSRALSDGGWYAPEKRPFLAHVTVARVRRHGHVRSIGLPSVPELSFPASSVTLFRSRLSREGAQYERLSEMQLTG